MSFFAFMTEASVGQCVAGTRSCYGAKPTVPLEFETISPVVVSAIIVRSPLGEGALPRASACAA